MIADFKEKVDAKIKEIAVKRDELRKLYYHLDEIVESLNDSIEEAESARERFEEAVMNLERLLLRLKLDPASTIESLCELIESEHGNSYG